MGNFLPGFLERIDNFAFLVGLDTIRKRRSPSHHVLSRKVVWIEPDRVRAHPSLVLGHKIVGCVASHRYDRNTVFGVVGGSRTRSAPYLGLQHLKLACMPFHHDDRNNSGAQKSRPGTRQQTPKWAPFVSQSGPTCSGSSLYPGTDSNRLPPARRAGALPSELP